MNTRDITKRLAAGLFTASLSMGAMAQDRKSVV